LSSASYLIINSANGGAGRFAFHRLELMDFIEPFHIRFLKAGCHVHSADEVILQHQFSFVISREVDSLYLFTASGSGALPSSEQVNLLGSDSSDGPWRPVGSSYAYIFHSSEQSSTPFPEQASSAQPPDRFLVVNFELRWPWYLAAVTVPAIKGAGLLAVSLCGLCTRIALAKALFAAAATALAAAHAALAANLLLLGGLSGRLAGGLLLSHALAFTGLAATILRNRRYFPEACAAAGAGLLAARAAARLLEANWAQASSTLPLASSLNPKLLPCPTPRIPLLLVRP
jgi:hypothetical protein